MVWSLSSQGRVYDSGDPLVVYFDPASGKTLLISEVAAFLLEKLQAGPRSTRALADLVAQNLDSAGDDGLPDVVEALLQDLESVDLVERD
jgi:PqqD family protein of HPr-rel-A system